MIKTPTYHVFDMYKCHQDAELLDSTLETEIVGLEEENMVPNLSESVSIDADGVMHITMTNLDLEHAYPIETTILGKKWTPSKPRSSPRKCTQKILSKIRKT